MSDRGKRPSPANDPADAGRTVTRRAFTTSMAAGAASLGFSAGGSAARARLTKSAATERADVVVVGGGMAGLVAANAIADSGRSVVVLEARDRVGGRIRNWRCGMPPACDCGQLIAPHHTRARALAKQFGVALYPQHAVAAGEGNDVVYIGGERFEVPAGGSLDSRALAPMLADGSVPLKKLDGMAATVSPSSPWEASNAQAWDAMTVETWKQQNSVSPNARFLIDFLISVATSSDPGDVSLLHFVTYLARLGDGTRGTDEVLDFVFLGDFVHGGLQQIPDRLARRLGDRLKLKAPVRRITQRAGSVRVESDAGAVAAKRVLVAMAPSLNALIDFEPALDGLRAQLAQRYPQGSGATEVSLIYARPFWRDKGLSGRGAGLAPFYTLSDYSPPDSPTGRLVASILGAQQRHYITLPAAERRRLALDNVATYLGGDPRAYSPMAMLERNWTGAVRVDAPWVDDVHAAWTRGCPGYLPPGVLASFGPAINAPFGNVHWAGTEHSVSYNTYVEGAIRSGEKGAAEVLSTL